MKRGFIFVFIAISLLFGQVVYAAEKEEEWDVIKKVPHKNATYSLVQNNQTDELYFLKEEKNKGKTTEIYQTLVGTYENKVTAQISLKKSGIILFISDQSDFYFFRMDGTSGEITGEVKLPSKKGSKGKKGKKTKATKKDSLTSKRLSLKSYQTLESDDPLEPPSFYTVENITPTSVTLKWSEVTGADEYRIYETAPFNEDDDTRRLVAETSSTDIEMKNLEANEFYLFYLRAVRDGVESEEIYTAIWMPSIIDNIDIETTSTQLSVDWSAVDGEYNYDLSVYDIAFESLEDKLYEENGTETNYTFDNLQPLTQYLVVLNATNSTRHNDIILFICMTYPLGEGEDDEVPDFPDPPAPTGDLPAPTDFTVEPEQTTAQLQWNPVGDAEGYVLWINGERKIEVGDVTSYELTGLTPYTPYELHLRAVDEDGRDGESSVQSFFTLPDHLDPPVVKIDRVTSISAYLTWKPVKAARTYTITYNGTTEQLEDENVKVTGLREQQRYVFKIVAEHRSVKSDPVEVEVETIPFSYLYDYDGSLLESVMDSYEKQWDYQYDKNGNLLKITYSPAPKAEKQEFDISGQ